jgi:DNA-binding CsgD family transcriptional regulator
MLDLKKSLEYANQAFVLAESYSILKDIYNSAGLLSKIYLKQNMIDSVLKYDTLKLIMKDSLDIGYKVSEMEQLEMKYELEKTELEYNRLRERDYLLLMNIVGALFTLLIILAFIFYRSRTRSKYVRLEKQKIEEELASKNKEMTANVVSLMKRNETLIKISSKLIKLENKLVKDENKIIINKIAHDLRETTNEVVWKEFDLRFKQVHADFYSRLQGKFPDLTSNELRLCAFLRLNMTTKEISQLTGQSINALEAARYRLRKKLGISNEQVDLYTFLIKA